MGSRGCRADRGPFMRRTYRLVLVATALASSIAVVGLLTKFSSASEGPIAATLDWLGTTVGSIEHYIRQTLKGGLGRSSELAWFRPYQTGADRLRRADAVLLGAYDSALPETLEGVVEFERTIGTTLPLVQLYTAWGDKPERRFPLQLATAIWD